MGLTLFGVVLKPVGRPVGERNYWRYQPALPLRDVGSDSKLYSRFWCHDNSVSCMILFEGICFHLSRFATAVGLASECFFLVLFFRCCFFGVVFSTIHQSPGRAVHGFTKGSYSTALRGSRPPRYCFKNSHQFDYGQGRQIYCSWLGCKWLMAW